MTNGDDVQKLSLLGEEIPVRVSDSDEAREAYTIVKDKIESIRQQSKSPSNLQLALLCSLNLAGELLNTEEQVEENQLSDDLLSELEDLSREINETLDGSE